MCKIDREGGEEKKACVCVCEREREREREREKGVMSELTRMYGKASPTTKFANQFTMVAMVTATGLASWRNSSATINHGMAPEHKKFLPQSHL